MYLDKLQSTLIYRIPGFEIVEKKGIFKRIDIPKDFNGFIISDFERNIFYGFFENEVGEEQVVFEKPIVISQSAYYDLANEFIHYLQDCAIDKAILSRIKEVDFNSNSAIQLFHDLEKKYPNAFCYLIDSPLVGVWIGATPETLIEIENGKGKTMALAGTKSSSDNTKWEEKEVHEQQLVTDFINDTLRSYCDVVVVSDRQEIKAGPVKHLVHQFDFSISKEKEWDLLINLHPTPAVSGFPREKALKCISNFEPHERSLYAGIIGIKTKEKTKLFVNLRSAQLIGNRLFLFVGGGITQASIAENEWEETENKAKTILNLIK